MPRSATGSEAISLYLSLRKRLEAFEVFADDDATLEKLRGSALELRIFIAWDEMCQDEKFYARRSRDLPACSAVV